MEGGRKGRGGMSRVITRTVPKRVWNRYSVSPLVERFPCDQADCRIRTNPLTTEVTSL